MLFRSRLREEEGDLARALDDLTRATMVIKAPAEAFRALGLVHKAREDKAAAVPAFEKYLAMAPEAPDAGLIKGYLAEMK